MGYLRAVRVAVIQLTSTDDLAANLSASRGFVAEAAERGAALVALPENFAYLRREGEPFPCAQGLDGEIVATLRELARRHEVWLLGGSFPERIPDDTRVYNTSVLLNPAGEVTATYRKIHLFDVDLRASGGGAFSESAGVAPGCDVVVADSPFGGIGLSVCYDVRFPEVYRMQAERGARWLAVPSAFTRETGKDHWEVLLRARAIENQAFVLAPAQCGRHSESRASHGRSLIADPWGLVIAQAGDEPTVLVAECPEQDVDRVRSRVPALANRRLGP